MRSLPSKRNGHVLFAIAFVCITFTFPAQRSGENYADVPVSVTQFSASQLADKGIFNVDLNSALSYSSSSFSVDGDRIRGTSSLNLRLGGGGNIANNWNLRGVVNVRNVNVVPEGSDLSNSVFTGNIGLDVERIEILKGPQG